MMLSWCACPLASIGSVFQLRAEVSTSSPGQAVPLYAAGLGDRDGDRVDDFVLVQNGPPRIEVRSGKTLELLREVPLGAVIEPGERIAQAAVGHDLDGDEWPELYVWRQTREPARRELLRVSLVDGRVAWRRAAAFPLRLVDWPAQVAFLRTLDSESIVFARPRVSEKSAYSAGRPGTDGGVVAVDCRTGGPRFERWGPASGLDASAGHSVAGLEDLDHDGFEDFAVSAPWQPIGTGANGTVELRSGRDGHLLRSIDSPTSATHGDCESFGDPIVALDDVDGDGLRDLGVTVLRVRIERDGPRTSYYSTLGFEVHSTSAVGPLAVLHSPDWNFVARGFAHAACVTSDLDGDGSDDLLLACPGSGSDEHGDGGALLAYRLDGTQIDELQGDVPGCILGHPFAVLRGPGIDELSIVTACYRTWRIYSIVRRAAPHDADRK
jgi:hypothetical protein